MVLTCSGRIRHTQSEHRVAAGTNAERPAQQNRHKVTGKRIAQGGLMENAMVFKQHVAACQRLHSPRA